MGTYVIRTPDIGEGIAEVELVAWHVKPGDEVKEDQVLADVMTDKATVEIPSPISGKVTELMGDVGQQIAVGADLIRLEVQGAGNERPGTRQAAPAQAAPVAETKPPAPVAATPSHDDEQDEPPAQRPPVHAPVAMRPAGEKPIASPAVRRRAWELGVELQFVHGSGAAGRITHQDLEIYLASRGQAAQARAGGMAYLQRDDETEVPVIGLRRKIAQKMQDAKRRIPHFSYVEEIDVTELEARRARLNAKSG